MATSAIPQGDSEDLQVPDLVDNLEPGVPTTPTPPETTTQVANKTDDEMREELFAQFREQAQFLLKNVTSLNDDEKVKKG